MTASRDKAQPWTCYVCGYTGKGVPTTKVLAYGKGGTNTLRLVPVCGFDKCDNRGPMQTKLRHAAEKQREAKEANNVAGS